MPWQRRIGAIRPPAAPRAGSCRMSGRAHISAQDRQLGRGSDATPLLTSRHIAAAMSTEARLVP
jgi:hypothetical protein